MPLVPFLPCLGIVFNFMLAGGLDLLTWSIYLVFLASGIIFYFSYSMRNSKLEASNVTRGFMETSIVSYAPPTFETTNGAEANNDEHNEFNLQETANKYTLNEEKDVKK